MEIKENEQLNVITDNSKVNINLLKQIEILKGENEDKDEIIEQLTNRFNTLNEEYTKIKEALKDIRNQLFDAKNCETILTKSIDVLLKD